MPIGEGGHQAGAMMHLLQRAGTGSDGEAPPGLQEAATHHVAWVLHLDGDLLPWHLLRDAQAGQGHAGGRGAVAGLLEDGAVRRGHPLELWLRGGTCKKPAACSETELQPTTLRQGRGASAADGASTTLQAGQEPPGASARPPSTGHCCWVLPREWSPALPPGPER